MCFFPKSICSRARSRVWCTPFLATLYTSRYIVRKRLVEGRGVEEKCTLRILACESSIACDGVMPSHFFLHVTRGCSTRKVLYKCSVHIITRLSISLSLCLSRLFLHARTSTLACKIGLRLSVISHHIHTSPPQISRAETWGTRLRSRIVWIFVVKEDMRSKCWSKRQGDTFILCTCMCMCVSIHIHRYMNETHV